MYVVKTLQHYLMNRYRRSVDSSIFYEPLSAFLCDVDREKDKSTPKLIISSK